MAGRCFGDGNPLFEAYHDREWGRPRRTEQALYEKICLEGLSAGLSWLTVLRKRAAFRAAFADFDPDAVARFEGIGHLLEDRALIRSAPKLSACVRNAQATVALRADGGLVELLWAAAELPSPVRRSRADVPASTPASAVLAGQLRQAGFAFVGPVTVYSLLQACGLVNDHLVRCPVRADVERERQASARDSGSRPVG